MEGRTFAELGRIEAIRQLFEGTGYVPFGEPLWCGAKAGEACTSVSRLFTEGVDFNLVYFPLKHLGYKCVVEVTGEHYAVMSAPHTLSVILGVSAKLDFDNIRELWEGIIAAAKEFGYRSVSLDLQPSRNGLAISVSAAGTASSFSCSKRPKAKSKDLICVSGSLGAAYLGLQILERERSRFENGKTDKEEMEKYRMLVGAYLKPELSPGIVERLEEERLIPSFGYFVTRGLSDALLRLSRDSGLGVKVYADKIPFEGGSFDFGKISDIDPISAAMNGGDDCKLLFTVPIAEVERFRRDFQTFDIIGHLAQSDVGTVMVTPDGVELTVSAQGW